MKNIIFIAIIATIAIASIGFAFFLTKNSLTTPSSMLSPKSIQDSKPIHTVGFLPYWQAASIENLRFDLLDEIIYFGLHTNEDGEIVTRDSDGNKDQGHAKMDTTFSHLDKARGNNSTKISIAIILQDNEKIEVFLENSRAQENLIDNISLLLKQYPQIGGINLDFEYSGIPAKETINSYTGFVAAFVMELKTHNSSLILSVDTTADAIKKSRLYDVAGLAKVTDYIILMGYDFYRPNSSVAGPVAPLTGKEIYEYDVSTAVADFLTVVPKEKLILGVPYYGWDFPTESEELGSFVEKRPDEGVALSTYKRNKRLTDEQNPKKFFDEKSQTPWMIYHDPDTNGIRQVWFENEISLGKKYDLVNNEGLAGIAIWALGYDGEHDELWKLLEDKFGKDKN